jgi:long-subunit acyl-CoA synthetase (AMP-forming)
MYLYHGMAVYYAEAIETLGPNLREVRPTILVGVPRILKRSMHAFVNGQQREVDCPWSCFRGQ